MSAWPLLMLLLPAAPAPKESQLHQTLREHGAQVMVGAGTQQLYRSLTLEQAGSSSTQTGSLWEPVSLWVGGSFYYCRQAALRARGLRGEAALGLSLLTQNLGVPLILRYATSWVQPLGRRWSFVAGLSFSLAVDIPDAEYARGQLGAPVGFAWRIVEVTWLPALEFPLARSSHAVPDGILSRGTALAFVPLSFNLSFRF